jgi:hypothetical protein
MSAASEYLNNIKKREPEYSYQELPDAEKTSEGARTANLLIAGLAPQLVAGIFGGAGAAAKAGELGSQSAQALQKGYTAEDDSAREMKLKKYLSRQNRGERIEDFGLKIAMASDEAKAKSAEKAQTLNALGLKIAQNAEKQGRDTEFKLRGEYQGLPQVKRAQELQEAYGKMLSAAEKPSAAGDLTIVYSNMKMLDPGSTVREGEFATAQNAAGIPERIRNVYNKAVSGERLSDAQRKDFIGQGYNLYNVQAAEAEKANETYSNLSQRYGSDPSAVATFKRAYQSPSNPQVVKEGEAAANQPKQEPDWANMDSKELEAYVRGKK